MSGNRFFRSICMCAGWIGRDIFFLSIGLLLFWLAVDGEFPFDRVNGVEFVRPEDGQNIRPCALTYADSFDEKLTFPEQKTEIRLKPDQEIIVFDPAAKKRLKIKLADIVVLRQTIREQQEEKEWRWKEGGSDEKLYTGRSYYWRKFGVELQIDDGRKISGVLASGFMVWYKVGEDWKKLVIKTRDKSGMLEKGADPKKDPKFAEYRKYLREIRFLVPVLKDMPIR